MAGRHMNWRNLIMVSSFGILIAVELFGVALAAGWALAGLFDALPKGADALVFTSGGPIAALAQDMLHVPDSDGYRLNWGLVNCGVTKLVRGRERLSTLNGHAHFEGEHAELVTYR